MHRELSPAYVFINFPAGGVLAGAAQGFFATKIEHGTKLPLIKLIAPTKKAKGGISASSAGDMIGIPLVSPTKDSADKPRFTAIQTAKMFMVHAQEWIPQIPNYLLQHIAKKRLQLAVLFRNASETANYYLNSTIVSDTLTKYLGDVKFKDLLCSVYIAAHNYTANNSASTSVFFSKEIHPDGREIYSHDPNMPVIEPMQASMAVPGHYFSKQIDGAGNFTDLGHVHSGLAALIRFKAMLPPNAKIIYIEMGTPRFHNLMTPKDHNLSSAFDIVSNGYLVSSTSNHAYSQAMQTIPYLLNGGEFFDLTPHFDRQNYTKNNLPFSDNFLDASQANMERILAAIEAHPGTQEKLKHVTKALLENHYAWIELEAEITAEEAITLPEVQPVTKRSWVPNWMRWPVGGASHAPAAA